MAEEKLVRASRRKYHYVYKITRTDGKYYIGMHSTDNLEDGYFGSGKRLKYSINKHGKENHNIQILEYLPCRDTLKSKEKELVDKICLLDPLCMNLREGGEGGGGWWDSAQASNAAMLSQKSLKRNRAQAAKKMVTTRKINGTLTGWKYFDGMKGKNHSSESKNKMASLKVGNKNNQFGKCWVMNEQESICIKKELLQEYLDKGYSKGRKIIKSN